jgi:hypothetical protein
MKYTQITAEKKGTGQKIIERYFEDGTRFIKHIPFSPQILVALKDAFKNKNVSIELGSNQWIRIKKTGENPELEEAVKQATGKSIITEKDRVNAESELLKKSGFVVEVKEVGE